MIKCNTLPQLNETKNYQRAMIKFAFLHTFYPLDFMQQIKSYPENSFGRWWCLLRTKTQITMLDRVLRYFASLQRRQLLTGTYPISAHVLFEKCFFSPNHFMNNVTYNLENLHLDLYFEQYYDDNDVYDSDDY